MADTPGGRALFYDENNNLLADMPIQAPLCSWAWDGWETTGPGIKRGIHIAASATRMTASAVRPMAVVRGRGLGASVWTALPVDNDFSVNAKSRAD